MSVIPEAWERIVVRSGAAQCVFEEDAAGRGGAMTVVAGEAAFAQVAPHGQSARFVRQVGVSIPLRDVLAALADHMATSKRDQLASLLPGGRMLVVFIDDAPSAPLPSGPDLKAVG